MPSDCQNLFISWQVVLLENYMYYMSIVCLFSACSILHFSSSWQWMSFSWHYWVHLWACRKGVNSASCPAALTCAFLTVDLAEPWHSRWPALMIWWEPAMQANSVAFIIIHRFLQLNLVQPHHQHLITGGPALWAGPPDGQAAINSLLCGHQPSAIIDSGDKEGQVPYQLLALMLLCFRRSLSKNCALGRNGSSKPVRITFLFVVLSWSSHMDTQDRVPARLGSQKSGTPFFWSWLAIQVVHCLDCLDGIVMFMWIIFHHCNFNLVGNALHLGGWGGAGWRSRDENVHSSWQLDPFVGDHMLRSGCSWDSRLMHILCLMGFYLSWANPKFIVWVRFQGSSNLLYSLSWKRSQQGRVCFVLCAFCALVMSLPVPLLFD